MFPEASGAPPVSADVYDSRGRFIASLAEAGGVAEASLKWDGCDSAGREVPAGIYYIRANDAPAATRKVVRIR
jgi:flagellar hook assembly protein FlgD